MRLRVTLMAVSLVSAAAMALAGCSSGGSSAQKADRSITTAAAQTSAASNSNPADGKSTTTSSSAPQTFADQSEATGVKYARCMRSNGIDIPDPATPEFTVTYPQNANGKAAFHTCSPFLPEKFHGQLPTVQELEQDFAFAKCMRESGLSDYPDPDSKYAVMVYDNNSQWIHDPREGSISKRCHRQYPLAGKVTGPRDFGPMG